MYRLKYCASIANKYVCYAELTNRWIIADDIAVVALILVVIDTSQLITLDDMLVHEIEKYIYHHTSSIIYRRC